jgi:hypothetical protein
MLEDNPAGVPVAQIMGSPMHRWSRCRTNRTMSSRRLRRCARCLIHRRRTPRTTRWHRC